MVAKPPYYQVLNLRIDTPSISQAIKRLVKLAQDRQSALFISLPNVEFFARAQRDFQLQGILNRAWWRLPNGVALQWAIYWQNLPRPNFINLIKSLLLIVFRPQRINRYLPERFHSTSFSWALLEAAAKHNLGVFLVGSPKPGIAHTASYLKSQLPGLKIAGYYGGRNADGSYKNFKQLIKTLPPRLRQSNADIILVGLGFPLQERLMNYLVRKLTHGVMIGEGGTFDYRTFGGPIRRAPKFVQAIGLEWLWRLIRQPHRLGRQLAIPRFIWEVYRTRRPAKFIKP